jgi:nitroreductase
MNPTIDILMKRKSVRAYSPQPISEETRNIILAATMWAPTAGNMMLYSILEVEDQLLKDRLAVTCDHQPFIARAPWVLVFLADYQRWYDYYNQAGVEALCKARGEVMRRPAEGDLLLACCDTLIAAHTAVTAAEALGLGSCYIGDILEQYDTHRDLFNLPQYVLPIAMVCFGYPTPEQARRKQPDRFLKEFIVYRDRYHKLNEAELESMMAVHNRHFKTGEGRKDGIENEGQFNYFKKFSAEFTYEMTRSVRAMIHNWTGINQNTQDR